MSTVIAEVILNKQTVGFFALDPANLEVWSGAFFSSGSEALVDGLTSPTVHRFCTCGMPSQPVMLYASDYNWHGSACFACNVIVAGRTVEPSLMKPGRP